MDTYQILDIALNVTFFVAVAAIAVTFSYLREKRVRIEAAVAASRIETSFKSAMNNAEVARQDTQAESPKAVIQVARQAAPESARIRTATPVPALRMSRAERELARSIGLGEA